MKTTKETLNYNNNNKNVFDGKRMRKAVFRKTIDYNTAIHRHHRDFTEPIPKNQEVILPDRNYIVNLLSPFRYQASPGWLPTTNFAHVSTNKTRSYITALLWTPDGRRLITGSQSGEFTLWGGSTFNFETILQAHEHQISSMLWSASEQFALSSDGDGIIKYWLPSLSNIQSFRGHREFIRGLTFSPGDFKFASCSDDSTIKVWDFLVAKEESVLKGHGWNVYNVRWHPTHNLLASGSKDNTIRLWDPRINKNLAVIHGHKGVVNDVKWNQNGRWLLTAGKDSLIKLYDIRTLKEIQIFKGHTKEVICLSWHPTVPHFFVSGSSDGSIMYWAVGYPEQISSFEKAHDYPITSLEWHPIGHLLASGSNDCTTRFWVRPKPDFINESTENSIYNTNQSTKKPKLAGFYSGLPGFSTSIP